MGARLLLLLGVAALLAGCVGGSAKRAADPAGLVPKDFAGCVRGGGRLDSTGLVCQLQINERLAPTAFAYCRGTGGDQRAVGSVSGLRSGNTRGDVCTLTYQRSEDEMIDSQGRQIIQGEGAPN
ncbi:MAG: hypothetical protein QNK05_01895 [Myxococcota bacterium]|nr:hypothetical protein [Myxococcota bacterium]